MKALIVAAGRGSRLVPHTDHYPKCFIPFAGRRLIDWQMSALKSAGVHEVVAVRGYAAENFDGFGIRCFDNPRWAETNMVYSLMCAKEALLDGNDWIISYGDILYEERLPKALIAAPGTAGVVVDRQWLKLWSARAEDPLADAESLRVGADGNLIDIGRKVGQLCEIEAQYIGLLRFDAAALRALISFYEGARPGADWLMGRSLEKCYMTDLVRGFIAAGHPVRAVIVDGGWVEFDTNSDLDLYTGLLAAGTLGQFWQVPS